MKNLNFKVLFIPKSNFPKSYSLTTSPKKCFYGFLLNLGATPKYRLNMTHASLSRVNIVLFYSWNAKSMCICMMFFR